MSIKCPQCHFENPDSALYCSQCSASLKSRIEPPGTETFHASPQVLGAMIADKYKILKELGRGGMGVVYKAMDMRLDRPVALKFLPEAQSGDNEARSRLIREAKAAATLDHPNICTVFEVDETGGQVFISMACIEGRSLKDKLTHSPLEIDEAHTIALQIAEGLKEAHERGIIHRDIKPANIMLTDKGNVKIMDFGLAKSLSGADLTKPAAVMGTAAYMSPEQARGDAVDQRTDVWSFGATLYEMLTGKLPFGTRRGEALIYAILHEKPDSLPLADPEIPPDFAQIILKALEKSPDRRYHTMDEVIRALTNIKSSAALSQTEKSIVVLPFANLSPDPDNAHFADGLTEEIIADLSMLDSLRVISRTSAMQLKNTDKNIREIGRLLDVQYVLEGSVRKAGSKLRITAQLIQADNDRHLWAKKFDGVLNDIFEIQENVSSQIVAALKGRITSKEQKKMAARHTFPNVGAYEAYSRAHYEFWKSEPESTERALRLLEDAIAAFGEDPLLISGVGAIHWQLYHYRGDIDESHLLRIEECAEKLFAADPESAHGHRLRSYLALHAGKTGDAIRHLRRSLDGDPSDTETLLWLSYLLAVHAGRPIQAKPVAERWLAIDPLHPISRMSVILTQWMNGEFDAATEQLEEWHRKEPEDQICSFYLGHLWTWTGRREEALQVAETMFRRNPSDGMGQALRFLTVALSGEKEKAKNSVPPSVRDSIWMDFHLPWVMAEGYAVLDERKESLKWLERAVEKGVFNYPVLNKLDPLLSNIRGEPRYMELMQKVKSKWENFNSLSSI